MKFFISYRTRDEPYAAALILAALKRRFRHDVFLDYESIRLSADFREVLWPALRACDTVVAVIGKDWMPEESTKPDWTPERWPAKDFVREELRLAFELDKRVVPVLVSNAVRPPPERLPEDIRQLAYHQGAVIHPRAAREDADRLADRLEELAADATAVEVGEVANAIAPAVQSSRVPSAVYWTGALVATLTSGGLSAYTAAAYSFATRYAAAGAVVAALTMIVFSLFGGPVRLGMRLLRYPRVWLREWRRLPTRSYAALATLLVVAGVAVGLTWGSPCRPGEGSNFSFETKTREGWDVRHQGELQLGIEARPASEVSRCGGSALAFDFELSAGPRATAQVKVEQVPLRTALVAWVRSPADRTLLVNGFVLERAESGQGTTWTFHWTDPIALPGGDWIRVRFRREDFTHVASDPPGLAPPLGWSDPPLLLGLEFRSPGGSGVPVRSTVYLDDIAVH